MGGNSRVRFPTLELYLTQNQGALATAGRKLTDPETQTLSDIFGLAVDLSKVRLVETNAAVNGRAYTLGNTIRFPVGVPVDVRTLVHETTHVWQYQTKGAGYISDSVWHQATGGQGAYTVEIVPKQSIHSYHAEQQGMIVERYWADDPKGWATNPDVCRMIQEIRRTRPISALEIQNDIVYGPGGGRNDPFMTMPDDKRPQQMLPLVRWEF